MTDDFFIRQNALLFFAMVGMLAGWAQHGSGSDNSE
jgi:hypothetical protein